MSTTITPIVLSGGSGSRLWPLSRKHFPKQFLSLVGKNTMLQETVNRVARFNNTAKPLIVCNEEHRFLVAEQMQQIGQKNTAIILEPAGRNTAPAVAVAALQVLKTDSNSILLVLPADHVILDREELENVVCVGADLASKGNLVTFGITPHAPETGYGYIQVGEKIGSSKAFKVQKFVEKPNVEIAKQYLKDGGYFWNSGIFMFKAQQYLDELGKNEPEILSACEKSLNQANYDLDFIRLDKNAFEASPSNSIDYAVMEKTNKASVIPLDANWNDVGSWSSLWEVHEKNQDGNVQIGETLQVDTQNSLIYSSGRLVATVGVKNHIIIETADAILVADKTKSQEVKEIVKLLETNECQRSITHRKVFRPWGNYDCIDTGHRFQVKRIVVNPKATLSLQMHHHRAEHWVVVKGTAKVTKGEDVFLLEENQSTYIPLGVTHRLENPGTIPLEIIEIQSGSYLGEDDIVRFEDHYGRVD